MAEERKKITTASILEMKRQRKKITMLTAYDYSMARILDEAGVDIVLVGDSLGNVILGYENTLPVTMEDMLHHTRAVARGVQHALVVADMPFMSFQLSKEEAVQNASRFIKEAGAEAVKTEGDVYLENFEAMIKAGIPVMGHLGFTPQLLHQIGGYRLQGRTLKEANLILRAAENLERIGVFAMVLEMVPLKVARKIRSQVKVPIIGIGAGPHCDGQVLVTHDLLGLYERFAPKFVKQYARLGAETKRAVKEYIREVCEGKFPTERYSF